MDKDYFNNLITKIKPDLAELSRKQYVNHLVKLFPDINTEVKLKKSLTLKKIEALIEKIEGNDKITDLSRRNTYNPIIVIVKHFFDVDSPQYVKLSNLRDKVNETYKEKSHTDMTEKETDNMVTSDEYEELLSDIEPKIRVILQSNKVSKADINDVIQYYILLIYYFYGYRVDITPMDFHYGPDKPDDTHKNYIWIIPKGNNQQPTVKFVFYQYKTAKTYGENIVAITDKKLARHLFQFYTFMKQVLPDNEIAFLNRRLNAYMSVSELSKTFSAFFKKHLNKNFTITLNRKRIVSESPDVKEYIQAKQKAEKLSRQMGHDLNMQEKVYFKKNVK